MALISMILSHLWPIFQAYYNIQRPITRLILSRVWCTQWFRFQSPWVTVNLPRFQGHGVIIDALDILCAQLTRHLFAIAISSCLLQVTTKMFIDYLSPWRYLYVFGLNSVVNRPIYFKKRQQFLSTFPLSSRGPLHVRLNGQTSNHGRKKNAEIVCPSYDSISFKYVFQLRSLRSVAQVLMGLLQFCSHPESHDDSCQKLWKVV